MQRSYAWLVRSTLLVFSFAAIAGVIYWRQPIYDWWVLRSYTPSAEIVMLADQGEVTARGRNVFYVTKPAIEASEDFNTHCQKRTEKTIVLGCYNGRNIYIYEVKDERLNGVKQVTAMHEMLHAAYDRLSGSEQERINSLLKAELKNRNDPYINGLVAEYQKSEPTEIENELHSIIGTEIADVSKELEQHYSKYFTNRKAVVAFANNYRAVFRESEQKIVEIDGRLTSLKNQITANEAQLKVNQEELEQTASSMSALRSSGDAAAYNKEVEPYNAKVQDFNNLLSETKSLISTHNELVSERNQLATAHNDLASSLNSNFSPVPAQ